MPMSTAGEYAETSSPHQKEIVSLQVVTILWMSTEALVAIIAAIRAQSVVLLGFGADSAIELASAVVVLASFQGSYCFYRSFCARVGRQYRRRHAAPKLF